MPRITRIPAVQGSYSLPEESEIAKRKVAAYARVSTDNEDQTNSFEAQSDYFTKKIKSREDWEFVEVYADEGITGTSTKHREGFKRMINDALAGKIDLILTKSISRFARNTVDSLSIIRQLKDAGVEVYFEKENINTLDAKGELFLTILASLAQEESRSISENVKWGQRKRYADGKEFMNYTNFLGYKKGPDGKVAIDEEQAKVVKEIYADFITGLTSTAIADKLTKEGHPTPTGKVKWYPETIRSILTNEKYMGDAVLQKYYIADYLTKKQVKNDGTTIPKYYVEDIHPAIIDKNTFRHVQAEVARRSRDIKSYSGKTIFSTKLRCGECGGWYGPKTWHSTDEHRKVVWQCNNKNNGKTKCKTPVVTVDEMKQGFVKMLKKLAIDKDELINCNTQLIELNTARIEKLEAEERHLNDELNLAADRVSKDIKHNASSNQDQKEYSEHHKILVKKADEAEKAFYHNKEILQTTRINQISLERFLNGLEKIKAMPTEFDEALWTSLVICVTIYKDKTMVFKLSDGETEITV